MNEKCPCTPLGVNCHNDIAPHSIVCYLNIIDKILTEALSEVPLVGKLIILHECPHFILKNLTE